MASTLRQGSTGPEVTDLQRRLKAAGFDPGPIDGRFGSRTDAAVRSYQQKKGLAVDGVVGPKTWAALGSGTGAAKPAATSSGGTAGGSHTEAQIIAKVMSGEFGVYLRPYLNVPEIRKLALHLAPTAWTGYKDQWSPELFIARVKETTWYRSHNQTQRDWLNTTSPADRDRLTATTMDKMVNEAMQLWGEKPFMAQFGSIAKFRTDHMGIAVSIPSGNQTYESWAAEWGVRAMNKKGTEANYNEQERQRARAVALQRPQEVSDELWKTAHGDYFLNIDKNQTLKWANDIVNGKTSYAQVHDLMRNQAAALFPVYSKSIHNGVLPSSLLAPTIGNISQELEISPDAVMDNPAFRSQITSQAAGATKPFTALDWIRYARSTPEYRKTEGANKLAGDFADNLIRNMGAVQ